MARKRIIDPAIWTDKKAIKLDIYSFTVFIGLFSLADDEGIKEIDPDSLHFELARKELTTEVIKESLDVLASDRFRMIIRYGEDLAFIPSFYRHQKIKYPSKTKHERPPLDEASKFPGYIDGWETTFSTKNDHKKYPVLGTFPQASGNPPGTFPQSSVQRGEERRVEETRGGEFPQRLFLIYFLKSPSA